MNKQPSSDPCDADPAADLALLRLVEQHLEYSQRELADTWGASLGKSHYVLHALLYEVLVKISNFQRSNRKLIYLYLITPSGLLKEMRLPQSFLARKKVEFDQLRSVFAELPAELGHSI